MSTTNISIRVDKQLKKQADSLFNELGMNMSTAFNVFIRQAVREGRIPFDISLNQQKKETSTTTKAAETKTTSIKKNESFANTKAIKDDSDFDSPFDISENNQNKEKLLVILEAEKGSKTASDKEDFEDPFGE